jgi:cytochrome P450
MRINPREIHIKDPRYYDEVYSSCARRQEKDPQLIPAFLSPHSVVSTIDHDHHRVRKNLLKNFFCRRSLERLGPTINTSTELLCQKLRRANSTDQPVQLESLFADLTGDVISHCAFGQSYDYLRQDGDVTNDIQHGAATFAVGFHVNRFIPVFRSVTLSVPTQLLKTLLPQFTLMLGRINTIHENARLSLERRASKNTDHDTIFDALTDASVAAEERTIPRLMDESWVILGAGTTTTARTLSMASFHIFSQERILRKLREELRSVMPQLDSQPTFAELEGLPYLVSCSRNSDTILCRDACWFFFLTPVTELTERHHQQSPPHLARCPFPLTAYRPRRCAEVRRVRSATRSEYIHLSNRPSKHPTDNITPFPSDTRQHLDLPHAHGLRVLPRAPSVPPRALDRSQAVGLPSAQIPRGVLSRSQAVFGNEVCRTAAAAERWQCTILTFLLRSQSFLPRDVQCSRAPCSQVRHGAPRDDGGECFCGSGDGLAAPGKGPLPGQGQGYAGCRGLVHTRSATGTAKGLYRFLVCICMLFDVDPSIHVARRVVLTLRCR